MRPDLTPEHLAELKALLASEAKVLGFTDLRVSRPKLQIAKHRLEAWLEKGFGGEMRWFYDSLDKRGDPAMLMPGTVTVISLSLPYLHAQSHDAQRTLDQPETAYIARYALGRDYHKVLRRRLKVLADRLAERTGTAPGRVFTDSAPVMEVEIAQQAGLGWRGKHSLLLNRSVGSWFFLGEMYTPLPLPVDAPTTEHCGSCSACMSACPTGAIVAPYVVDARRCISYLTIEHPGAIPEALRPKLGNRIYGCDDCQLVCPWNDKTENRTQDPDFEVRHRLDQSTLTALFEWTESDFYNRMLGSPIRRIGYERWLRNIAVALGNGPATEAVRTVLRRRWSTVSPLVQEHIEWALKQLS